MKLCAFLIVLMLQHDFIVCTVQVVTKGKHHHALELIHESQSPTKESHIKIFC